MLGAWDQYDKYELYTKASLHAVTLQSVNFKQKQQLSGETLAFLEGSFVDHNSKREFKYPVSQFVNEQFQEKAKELREPKMGHPYVPRPPMVMELTLAERDIAPDNRENSRMGYAIILGILSGLCFLLLT